MNNIDQEIQTIQKNLKGIKNTIIRKRALMILKRSANKKCKACGR